MNNTELTEYGMYLASLMGHSLSGTEPAKPFEGFDWEYLYKLARFHNVVSLIYPAVSTLEIPKETLEEFEYENHRHMAREARQEIEAQRVFNVLNHHNIPFIKLKGIVIKNLYPMPYMRSASDVDICMSKEDRQKAFDIMDSLGYTLESSINYHDEYSKDNFFIYEIHSDVISTKSNLYPLFKNPFEKSTPDKDNNLQYVLSPEYFYLNLVTHLHKHFISEGCGLRLFSDIYIYRKAHPEIDFSFINKVLKKYSLTEFHNNIINLTECFFENKQPSEKLRQIALYVFKSGEYGNPQLKKLSWLSSTKSNRLTFKDKAKYFLGNWFPGVKMLKRRYPILEKAPFLLPVCWIRRIFYTIFFKRSALKEQRDEIKRLNSDELKEAKRIRNLAGLK